MKKITTPITDEVLTGLKAGDTVLINGTIYTARDAAHKRLVEMIQKTVSGERLVVSDNRTPNTEHRTPNLPFEIKGAVIYYVGPSPAKPGMPIGSAGPTTSYRMDAYSPFLIEHGLKGMIGKGNRSKEVIDAMKKYNAVYFAAVGGAGALLSKCIKKAEVIAYDDLGPEAIRKLEVENFPVVVINDMFGNDLYEEGIKKYKK